MLFPSMRAVILAFFALFVLASAIEPEWQEPNWVVENLVDPAGSQVHFCAFILRQNALSFARLQLDIADVHNRITRRNSTGIKVVLGIGATLFPAFRSNKPFPARK